MKYDLENQAQSQYKYCTMSGHSAYLHPGPCSSVGMWRGTDRQTHTDGRDNIDFASATPHTKCNKQVFRFFLEQLPDAIVGQCHAVE